MFSQFNISVDRVRYNYGQPWVYDVVRAVCFHVYIGYNEFVGATHYRNGDHKQPHFDSGRDP